MEVNGENITETTTEPDEIFCKINEYNEQWFRQSKHTLFAAGIGLQMLKGCYNSEILRKALLHGDCLPWAGAHHHVHTWTKAMKQKCSENEDITRELTTDDFIGHFQPMDDQKESSYSGREVTVYKNIARDRYLSDYFACFVSIPFKFGYALK